MSWPNKHLPRILSVASAYTMSDSYTNTLLIYMADMPSRVNESVILTMSYDYSHMQQHSH